ncbi:hypothetical protein FS749_010088 [Ceratobasidium sp. UAMH 11750]|nr:hypothetical protein FS749_010088 [Ceratobasidium sp. UAMH 11750]
MLNTVPKRSADGDIVHRIYASCDLAEFVHGDQGKICINSIERWVTLAQKPVPLATHTFPRNDVGNLFAPGVVELVHGISTRFVPELRDALAYVQEYETLGPPQANQDILFRWKSGIVGDTPILPAAPLDTDSEKAWLLCALPEQFVQIACNAHSFSSPGFLLYWLSTQPFLDPHTGLQLGGFHGAAFGIKLIVRMAIALYAAEQSGGTHVTLYGRMTMDCLRLYIRQFTIMFSSQVDSSLSILRDQRHSHLITPSVDFSVARYEIPAWQHIGKRDNCIPLLMALK